MVMLVRMSEWVKLVNVSGDIMTVTESVDPMSEEMVCLSPPQDSSRASFLLTSLFGMTMVCFRLALCSMSVSQPRAVIAVNEP